MVKHKFTEHSKRLQETAEAIADLSFYCDALPGMSYTFTYSSGSYDGGYIHEPRAKIEVHQASRRCKYCGWNEIDTQTPEQKACRHCYIADSRTVFSWGSGRDGAIRDAVNEFIGDAV